MSRRGDVGVGARRVCVGPDVDAETPPTTGRTESTHRALSSHGRRCAEGPKEGCAQFSRDETRDEGRLRE